MTMFIYYQAASWSTVKTGLGIQDLLIGSIGCFLSISNIQIFVNSSFSKLVHQFIEHGNHSYQQLPIKIALIN